MNNGGDHGLNLIANQSHAIHYEHENQSNNSEAFQQSRIANNCNLNGYINVTQFAPPTNDNITSSMASNIIYHNNNEDTMFAICSNLKSENSDYC